MRKRAGERGRRRKREAKCYGIQRRNLLISFGKAILVVSRKVMEGI